MQWIEPGRSPNHNRQQFVVGSISARSARAFDVSRRGLEGLNRGSLRRWIYEYSGFYFFRNLYAYSRGAKGAGVRDRRWRGWGCGDWRRRWRWRYNHICCLFRRARTNPLYYWRWRRWRSYG